MSTNSIKERQRELAWFTAASATYLDLGLTLEQRICLYEECLEVAKEHGDERLVCLCDNAKIKCVEDMDKMTECLEVAMSHFNKQEYEHAILHSEKYLLIAQESGDKMAKITAYMTLGVAHLEREEYDDAILYGKKCLAIAQESGDQEAEMNAYMTLRDAHLKKEEYDDAILNSERCLIIAQKSGDQEAEMNVYRTLRDAHLKKEEYDDVILYSKKCLIIAQESGDKVAEMNAYRTLENAHLKKEEYDDAILYSKKSLAIAQESGDKVAEMKAFMILGGALLKKEEYNDVIFYSEKYLTIAKETGDKVAEMNAYMTLEDAYLKKEEYDDAISYSKKCLAIAQEYGDKGAEVNAYMALGSVHLMKEEFDDAISYSEKCLTIAQDSGDKVVEMNAYMILGDAHLRKEQYDDATLYSKKCLTIAQQSSDNVAEMNAYMTLGAAHLEKEEYDDAILCSNNCLAITQESGDKVAETHSVNAYLILGNAHLKKKEYDNAILYSKKCCTIAQESGQKVAQMKGYMTSGNAHLKKEEYDDAILYSKKCLDIAQESCDKVAEMNACMVLGNAHLRNKEYDDAVLYSEKCLTITKKSGDKVAEMNAYMILGNAHLKKTGCDDAILYSEKCLAIAKESGDKVAEMNACLTLGDAHLKKEEYDDAILYSKKSLAIAQETGDKKAEMNAYLTLGDVRLKKEEYDDAHFCTTEVIRIARDLEDNKVLYLCKWYLTMIYETLGVTKLDYDHLLIGLIKDILVDSQGKPSLVNWTNYFERYRCHRENQEYEKAISCLEEVVKMFAEAGHSSHASVPSPRLWILWTSKYFISEMYDLLGQSDKALHYQQEALDVACKEGTKSNQALSNLSLGEIYYKLGQFKNAENSLKESLKFYELIFDGLKQNDEFKIALIDKHKKAYKMLLKVLVETNKKEEALLVSDHYRAKALKDLLVSSYGMNKEQLAKEGLQYADVQSLVSSSNYTLLFYSTCFEKLCTFLVEADELEYLVQDFIYCEKCLDKLVDKTFDDMEVRQIVNCEDRSLDVTDDPEENKNSKEDELTQLLTRQIEERLSEAECRSTCGNRGDPSENSGTSSLTRGSGLGMLYHKLIPKSLIKQDEIVIIPDGPLCKVPFAALRDPDTGQYLSETKRIRMAPSMTSLKLLQNSLDHHSSKEALIIAASTVGQVMLNGVETEIRSLLGAPDEAIAISTTLGVKPLLRAEATKPVVIKRLQEGASVVHIAAHGYLKKATIALAPSPESREAGKIPDEEDYMLTMADVQQAQVHAQLVVLSCCHSGRGEIKAEGVVGMCRAFLASGARAVMGSLWAVNDAATLVFMDRFYDYLKEGKSASTSLNLTMKDMREIPEFTKPKYWAPFFLMGDDVTPFPVKVKDQHHEIETC